MKEIDLNCEYVTWPDGRRMAVGIKSIASLFGVSYVTANKYKNTILKPAVVVQGKKTFIDIDMAIRLYSASDDNTESEKSNNI